MIHLKPCFCWPTESCRNCTAVPREQWRFVGRRRHYGYDFWVWELVANPRTPHQVGRIHTDLTP